MAQKNRANMLTDIVNNIYNNLINFITGQNAQDRFVNLLDSSPNILSDASQPNGYVSTDANNEMFSSYYDEEISRADLITDLTANLAVGGKFYRINDAVGSTITLLVIAESNINLYSIGTNIATGEQGTYDITTDVFIPIVVSGTPDLQQVTDVGFTTTNAIVSDDGAGNAAEVNNGFVRIATGNTGSVNINASQVTATYTAQLPAKATSPQTFAMLSDVGSLDLEVNGTPNVDQTLLNLIEGVNIDIADNGTGGVTITSLSDRYSTSSITSNSISNGAKTFTVDADLAYIPLQEVLIVYDPSNHMHATVTSYSGTTLVVDVKTHTGSGTYTSWVLNLDGVPIDAITGVGTANEIAYFTAGQVIASLAVATYPSLTELFSRSSKNKLNNLIILCRHHSICCLLTAQHLKSVPPLIRSNCKVYCVFKSNNFKKVLENIYEEVSGLISPDEFENMYMKSTEEAHDHLTIIIDNKMPKQYRFRKNWNDYFIINK